MGTISSRTSNKNMGNTCSHIDDKPTQPEGSPVKLFTVLPGSVSPPPLLHRGDSNQQGAVCIDHSDIRLRAESEFSNSTQDADRTSNIYVKYQGDCLKNGQILSVVLLPHQHTLFCERKVSCVGVLRLSYMSVLSSVCLLCYLATRLHCYGQSARNGSAESKFLMSAVMCTITCICYICYICYI